MIFDLEIGVNPNAGEIDDADSRMSGLMNDIKQSQQERLSEA